MRHKAAHLFGPLALLVIVAGVGFAQAPAADPRVEHRARLNYVAVRARTPMQKLGSVIPKSLGEVFAWMRRKGVKPSGPPFIRYLVIDMAHELDVELCVPVAGPISSTGRVHAGALPAGTYVTMTALGPPDGLVKANADLQAWARRRGIRFQSREAPKGTAFAGRAEFYLTDPDAEPDPKRWRTEIVYLTVSGKRP